MKTLEIWTQLKLDEQTITNKETEVRRRMIQWVPDGFEEKREGFEMMTATNKDKELSLTAAIFE